jgi:hypothetical protein
LSSGTEYSGGDVVVVTAGRNDGDVTFERVVVEEVKAVPDGTDPVVLVVTAAASPFVVDGDSDGVCAAGRSPERDEQAASSNNAAVTIGRVRPGRPSGATFPMRIAGSTAHTSRHGVVSGHLIGVSGPRPDRAECHKRALHGGAGPTPNGAIEPGIRWLFIGQFAPQLNEKWSNAPRSRRKVRGTGSPHWASGPNPAPTGPPSRRPKVDHPA